MDICSKGRNEQKLSSAVLLRKRSDLNDIGEIDFPKCLLRSCRLDRRPKTAEHILGLHQILVLVQLVKVDHTLHEFRMFEIEGFTRQDDNTGIGVVFKKKSKKMAANEA